MSSWPFAPSLLEAESGSLMGKKGSFDFGFFNPFLFWLGLPAQFFALVLVLGLFHFATSIIKGVEGLDSREELDNG